MNVIYGIYLVDCEIEDFIDNLINDGLLDECKDLEYSEIQHELEYIFETELVANNLLHGPIEVFYIDRKIYIGIDVLERGSNVISFLKLYNLASYDEIFENIIEYFDTDCDIQLRVVN